MSSHNNEDTKSNLESNLNENFENDSDIKQATNDLKEKLKIDNEEILTEEELKTKYEKSLNLKNEGNSYFKEQNFKKSLVLYKEAFNECPKKYKENVAILLNNLAVCKWKILEQENENLNFKDENIKKEFEIIINHLNESIEIDENYFKPYLKRAELNHRFGEDKLDNSLEDYKKLLDLIPKDNLNLLNQIKTEIIKLDKEIEVRNQKLKDEMLSQLKNLGNLCLKPFGLSTDNFKLQQNSETGGYSINFQNN